MLTGVSAQCPFAYFCINSYNIFFLLQAGLVASNYINVLLHPLCLNNNCIMLDKVAGIFFLSTLLHSAHFLHG